MKSKDRKSKHRRAAAALDQMRAKLAAHESATRGRMNAPPGWEPRSGGRLVWWFWLGMVSVWFGQASGQPLDSNLPPGGNFDLSHWKLTLPDANATEIPAEQLDAGYTNSLFFYTAQDGAMTFWSPVTGGVTGETDYPRSELRELLNPDNE